MAQYTAFRDSRSLRLPAATTHDPERIFEMPLPSWDAALPPPERAAAVSAVESGAVLLFPRLAFRLSSDEQRFLDPRWHDGKAKNISFDVKSGTVAGTTARERDLAGLTAMMRRFAEGAARLCATLFADYQPAPAVMRTSFRAMPADERESSWRKDDRLLHIDAFPSRPNHGDRILRVFCNVNPQRPRVWRVGERFEHVARRFYPGLPPFRPIVARTLSTLHVTRGVRSAYDHYMLHLHDAMKADAQYQREASQIELPFPPGSTWVCFSDQVSHAVMRGQYMFEQTLHVPVSALQHPERSPLRVLERIAERPLA